MDLWARWVELMSRPEEEVPLDEAALLISAAANPLLDVAAQLRRLDQIAAKVEGADTSAICQVLFDQLGLRGDRESYDDPSNSYLDQVLDRGRGIPISLSVLLIEVGRRRGVALEAVGMPGHFLVRDPSRPEELIDPFDRGRRLDEAGCAELLRSTTGRRFLLPGMLDATGPWAILARMLANLDRSYHQIGDTVSLGTVSRLRLNVPEAPLADRAQLAERLADLGRLDEAANVLEKAAEDDALGRQAEVLLAQSAALRARLN